MIETWFFLESGPGSPPDNMALDEALLRQATRVGRPVLRWYAWTEAAATFGYFQKYGEVSTWTRLRPLIRRPTGGGLVPHDGDWTYSLVFPPDHAWCQLKAAESYQCVHQWIQSSFASVGIEAKLSPSASKELPGRCFAGAEKSDLLWENRKIAGAAQRRNRHGLLIQGSIQPPNGLARPSWQTAMLTTGPPIGKVEWRAILLDDNLRGTARDLAEEKYNNPRYNQAR